MGGKADHSSLEQKPRALDLDSVQLSCVKAAAGHCSDDGIHWICRNGCGGIIVDYRALGFC